MAKFGWDERRLFFVSEAALENLSSTPSDAASGQMLTYIKSDHLHIKKPSVAEVMIPENGSNIGGFNEIFKQKTAAALLEFRTLQSSDGTINFTQNANDIDITVDLTDINDELDHGALLGLGDDDHLQYLLLAGRAGGQIANGGTASGDDLELRSTAHATKGSVQIIDGSEFRHGDNHKQQYVVQTTNATPTAVATVALSDDRTYQFKVMVVSRRSDAAGSKGAWELQACAFRESAGAATLLGSVKQNFQNKSGASQDVNITVSSNNVVVQVTGIAAETIEWKAYVEYLESN